MNIPEGIDGVFMIVVPGLYHDRSNFERVEYVHVLNKLWIFALLALDRIFFVDVDCVFLKPVDELFARREILVCPDYVETRATEKFNSGVIVFCPDKSLLTRIFIEVNVVTSDDGGDQGYLNAILRDEVVCVHEKYNLTRHFKYFSRANDLNDVRIIHYIVKKPWSLQYQETPDGLLVDLDDLWTSYLSPDECRELIADWRRSIFHISERRRIENVGPEALGVINARIDALEGHLNNRRRIWRDAAKLAFAMLAGAGAAYVALRIWS
jgi:lipopolysaccharide biosynthesis glycosyltransferase